MLNDIVTVATNLFRMYIIWRFAGIFLDVEQAGHKKQVLGYGIFYMVNSTLFVVFHSPFINVLINLLGIYILYSVLYGGRSLQRILAVGTMYALAAASDLVVVLLLNPKFRIGNTVSPLSSVATVLVLLVLEILCEYIIKEKRQFKMADAIRLLSIPVISLGMISYLLVYHSNDIELLIVVSTGIMVINVVILYYYNQIQMQYEKEYKQQLLQLQMQEYEMQLVQMHQSYQKIRSMKHELKHFAYAVEEEIKKGHLEEVGKILSEMKASVSEYEAVSWSGHPVLDSILNYLQEKARMAGAVIEMGIKVPEDLHLNALDMNILLGNLLENAIEAVQNIEDKTIRLQMRYDIGVLLIHTCNSYGGTVKIKNGIYMTQKADKENHGIGLINVKRIVDQYDGTIKIESSEGKFDVNIVLVCKL